MVRTLQEHLTFLSRLYSGSGLGKMLEVCCTVTSRLAAYSKSAIPCFSYFAQRNDWPLHHNRT